jgi:hypothetical protein
MLSRMCFLSTHTVVSYETVLTSIYTNTSEFIERNESFEEEVLGSWEPVDEFIYFDGTSNEPMPLRTVANAHYLPLAPVIASLCLSTIAVLLALASAAWVFVNRDTRIVAASQPEFLYSLCFGAALVASSSYFFSFDESYGFSEQQLSRGCSAYVWFFVIGYLIMFCSVRLPRVYFVMCLTFCLHSYSANSGG